MTIDLKKKTLYAAVLSMIFVGSSCNVLGLIPLGPGSSLQDKALGMVQFFLSMAFSHGSVNTNAAYEVMKKADAKLTDYSQKIANDDRGKCSAFSADVREAFGKCDWKKNIPAVIAILIAGYAPLLDALNARSGIRNLIPGDTGKVLSNIGMALNWGAIFGLLSVQASSLLNGYKKDFMTLWKGAEQQKEDVATLADIFREKVVLDSMIVVDNPLENDSLIDVMVSNLSVEYLFKGEPSDIARSKRILSEESRKQLELQGINVDDFRLDSQQLAEVRHHLMYHPEARKMLKQILSSLLDSPLLLDKVRKTLSNAPVKYSNAAERTKAAGRLAVRFFISWLAANGLSITFTAPMVVNHYRSLMPNSSLGIDCSFFQNTTNGTRDIEHYDNTLFELGIASYMAQGLSLSNAAIKVLESVLLPLSFILAGCDMDNMHRAWQSMWRGVNKFAILAGCIGAGTFSWVVSSAGEKYSEYLELLDCDVGVPDSKVVVEFDSAAVITQVLVTCIVLNLCTESFNSILRLSKPCQKADHKESDLKEVDVVQDTDQGELLN